MKDKSVIIYICNSGFAHEAMDAARSAGAKGGTILHGRSSLSTERQKFFGVTVHPEKEVLMIVCLKEEKKTLMEAINENHGVGSKAGGVIFSMEVEDTLGINFTERPFSQDE